MHVIEMKEYVSENIVGSCCSRSVYVDGDYLLLLLLPCIGVYICLNCVHVLVCCIILPGDIHH